MNGSEEARALGLQRTSAAPLASPTAVDLSSNGSSWRVESSGSSSQVGLLPDPGGVARA